MIEGLEHALGVRAQIKRLPEQPGDVPQTWAAVDKAAQLLRYAPHTSYANGVAKFTDWLKTAPTPSAATEGQESTRPVPATSAPTAMAQ